LTKEEQLNLISNKLDTLLGGKKAGVTSGRFWAGISLLIISTLGSALLFFGSVKSDLKYLDEHTKNAEIHVFVETRAILESYVQHEKNKDIHMPLTEKIKVFAQKKDLDKLEKRVDNLVVRKN